jgi:hypothetical protein
MTRSIRAAAQFPQMGDLRRWNVKVAFVDHPILGTAHITRIAEHSYLGARGGAASGGTPPVSCETRVPVSSTSGVYQRRNILFRLWRCLLCISISFDAFERADGSPCRLPTQFPPGKSPQRCETLFRRPIHCSLGTEFACAP